MNVLNFFDLQRFDEEITINYTVVDDDGNETSSTITVTSTTLIQSDIDSLTTDNNNLKKITIPKE